MIKTFRIHGTLPRVLNRLMFQRANPSTRPGFSPWRVNRRAGLLNFFCATFPQTRILVWCTAKHDQMLRRRWTKCVMPRHPLTPPVLCLLGCSSTYWVLAVSSPFLADCGCEFRRSVDGLRASFSLSRRWRSMQRENTPMSKVSLHNDKPP